MWFVLFNLQLGTDAVLYIVHQVGVVRGEVAQIGLDMRDVNKQIDSLVSI